ncbi:hypothetical protein [Ruegeria faecimaris]|uniref:hypothetical protein n=1 Tax=Ruegeria faecimaris TaxID=686389 RepID=UPI002330F896|nr:hypothetical protein [Ruegeria faecimaris]
MKRFLNSFISFILAANTLNVVGSPAEAQSLPRQNDPEMGWRHTITPYLFLPFTTEGTSEIDGIEADIDLSLSDILDILQGAASVRYEGWNGDWGIQAELYHVYIGEDGTLPGPLATDVELDIKQTYFSFQGAYRFANGSNAAGHRYAADVSFGVKWNRLKQEVNLTNAIGRRTIGGTEEWFEPMVGIRYGLELNKDWRAVARAELSGFGINGDDLQYLVLLGVDWRAWENMNLRFGYQFYGIDFSTERSNGGFAYDVNQNGPYLGLAIHF